MLNNLSSGPTIWKIFSPGIIKNYFQRWNLCFYCFVFIEIIFSPQIEIILFPHSTFQDKKNKFQNLRHISHPVQECSALLLFYFCFTRNVRVEAAQIKCQNWNFHEHEKFIPLVKFLSHHCQTWFQTLWKLLNSRYFLCD